MLLALSYWYPSNQSTMFANVKEHRSHTALKGSLPVTLQIDIVFVGKYWLYQKVSIQKNGSARPMGLAVKICRFL